MRRVAGLIVVTLALAVAIPSGAAVTDAQSCSSSTAATATPLLDTSGPQCSFELSCFEICFYLVTLDVAGTGLVSGSMTVSELGGDARFFTTADPAGETPPPACGPELFRCESGTALTGDGDVVNVLRLEPDDFQPAVRILCTGGGLAAGESVSCTASLLESFT